MFKKLFLLSILFYAVSVFAASASDSVSALLKNMQSMQANFSQTVTNKKGKILQKSTGRMYLQRPSQFRWDVLAPNKQLIVTNGTRLWIYDPDLEQVTIRSLTKAAGETPALLLSDNNLSVGKEFTVSELQQSSQEQWFLLIPNDKNSMIAQLKLGFSQNQIQDMQLKDHIGNITNIHFTQVKLNLSLSSSLFSFKPPKHIDVIDETKH